MDRNFSEETSSEVMVLVVLGMVRCALEAPKTNNSRIRGSMDFIMDKVDAIDPNKIIKMQAVFKKKTESPIKSLN
jgi:hypothetical protein